MVLLFIPSQRSPKEVIMVMEIKLFHSLIHSFKWFTLRTQTIICKYQVDCLFLWERRQVKWIAPSQRIPNIIWHFGKWYNLNRSVLNTDLAERKKSGTHFNCDFHQNCSKATSTDEFKKWFAGFQWTMLNCFQIY